MLSDGDGDGWASLSGSGTLESESERERDAPGKSAGSPRSSRLTSRSLSASCSCAAAANEDCALQERNNMHEYILTHNSQAVHCAIESNNRIAHATSVARLRVRSSVEYTFDVSMYGYIRQPEYMYITE